MFESFGVANILVYRNYYDNDQNKYSKSLSEMDYSSSLSFMSRMT
jgi:hypothetical protein